MSKREIWKPTVNGYEVSNMGNIRNPKRNNSILKPNNNGHGYLQIYLHDRNYYIHRLVAAAFLGGNHDGMVVNHVDHNTINNCVENLEWCTQKQNVAYSSERMKGVRKGKKPLHHIRKKGSSWCVYICKKETLFSDISDAIRFRDRQIENEKKKLYCHI